LQTVSAPSTRENLVLTVANIQERKGLLEYVDEAREVIDALPNARFVFLGADRMDGLLQETIAAAGLSRFMSVQGFVQNVEPWLLQAKVVVLPSRYGEGAPTSLLEAMACGTPVIAFDIDGISDIVRHEVDGLVGSLEDGLLSKSILRLLTDPETLDRMSLNGIRRVQKDFTVTKCAQEHAAVFLAAAGQGPTPDDNGGE